MKVVWIACIVIIIIACIVLLAAAGKIRSKIREFSRAAWGTDSVTEGIEKMKYEYSAAPKSVSAMTSLYLPKITKDFPEFKLDEAKNRAESTLRGYLRGLTEERTDLLTHASGELKEKLKSEIEMKKASGKKVYYSDFKLHRTEISSYQKKLGRCIITFQSAVEYRQNTADAPLRIQSKYDLDMIYIQDREIAESGMEPGIGLKCPNCDAPLAGLGEKICEYCGTPVKELNIHVWKFGDVRELKG